MTALTVAEATSTLEDALAAGLAHPRPRPGPRPRRAALPRVRPVPEVGPALAPVPRVEHDLRPAHTLRTRISVLRGADRTHVQEAADDQPAAVAVDHRSLVGSLALASIESLVGRRPVAQLARWLTPGVYDALHARATASARVLGPRTGGRAVVVRNVRTCRLDERVVEASAVVDDGIRVRALALRLEAHRQSWRVTALEIG
ncbi:MAG: Rv3235 family protein [Cellulomonas sp.]|uniref:Rv3235 family protein n=1 Tax=Cellulomonas sp. TaxID=40001 RepID=UPI00258EE731|nr:Rv3235 family protein [Cellulomonas sp.]MCR6647975.1 Rv3235 family protein [Cellulomonas sp.]MCR6703908.1 Rv3235 family protein [Cellulomonas sp.]